MGCKYILDHLQIDNGLDNLLAVVAVRLLKQLDVLLIDAARQ